MGIQVSSAAMARSVAFIVLALCVAFAAADILVDDYTTITNKLVLDTGAKSSSVTGSGIVGGERDVTITGQSAGCTQSFPDTFVQGGFFLSNPSVSVTTCQGKATATYDGTDGADTNALGLNLDLSTATAVVVVLANDNIPGNRYTFNLYSAAGDVCTHTEDHTGRGSDNPDTVTIPMSSFSNGCSLSSIKAIDVIMEGGIDVDQNIRSVTISQPALGGIIVSVFDDCDCNGSKGANEANKVNVAISVVGTGSCSSVSLNAYTVTMNGQTTCTGASSSATVNVVAGQTASASFGVFCPPQTGDITGLIFQDCDCDGVQESGDNGVSGVTVSVAPAAGSTGCSAA